MWIRNVGATCLQFDVSSSYEWRTETRFLLTTRRPWRAPLCLQNSRALFGSPPRPPKTLRYTNKQTLSSTDRRWRVESDQDKLCSVKAQTLHDDLCLTFTDPPTPAPPAEFRASCRSDRKWSKGWQQQGRWGGPRMFFTHINDSNAQISNV